MTARQTQPIVNLLCFGQDDEATGACEGLTRTVAGEPARFANIVNTKLSCIPSAVISDLVESEETVNEANCTVCDWISIKLASSTAGVSVDGLHGHD